MSNRVELAAALEMYSDPRFVLIDLSPELRVLVIAARERLAQLDAITENALSVREAPEVDKNQLEVPFKNDRGAW